MIHYLKGNVKSDRLANDDYLDINFGRNLFVVECELSGGVYFDSKEVVQCCNFGVHFKIRRVVILEEVVLVSNKLKVLFQDEHMLDPKVIPLDALFNEEGLPTNTKDLPAVMDKEYCLLKVGI